MLRHRRFRAIRRSSLRPPRVSRTLRVEPLEARDLLSFLPPVHYAVGRGPGPVAVGDFNTDGLPDLAVINAVGAGVSVLLGNGDGSFQDARDFRVARFPISLAVGEFNGDGVPDLAVADYTGDSLSTHLGNGDGTFRAARFFSAGSFPLFVAAGEFNGDGVQDLVFVNADAVGVLLGNGDGTLQGPETTDVDRGARFLAAADLNGDGLDDVATSNFFFFQSSVSVLLNDGVWGGAAPGGGIPPSLFDLAHAPAPATATTSLRDGIGVVSFFVTPRRDDPETALPQVRQPVSGEGVFLLSLDEEIQYVPYSLS